MENMKNMGNMEKLKKKNEEKIEKIIWVQKDIFHLDGGGPLDIPAVDKGKDGDAEDGEQFDHLEIEDLVNVILISRLIQFINSSTTLRFRFRY